MALTRGGSRNTGNWRDTRNRQSSARKTPYTRNYSSKNAAIQRKYANTKPTEHRAQSQVRRNVSPQNVSRSSAYRPAANTSRLPGGSGSSGSSGIPRSAPVYRPPAPPQPVAKSYDQLLAMVKADPTLAAQIAGIGRLRSLSDSAATQNLGLIDTDYNAELASLGRQRDDSLTNTKEEAASAGRLRSTPYSNATEKVRTRYTEGAGRLGRRRNQTRAGIYQASKAAREQYDLSKNDARQNAINRLLSSRTDIKRGY